MSNPGVQPELWKGAYTAPPNRSPYTHRRTLGGKLVLVPEGAKLEGDRKCKECGNFLRKRMGYASGHRIYFKCKLIGDSSGPATDKRANDPSCEMFLDPMPGRLKPLTEEEQLETARQIGEALGVKVAVEELENR